MKKLILAALATAVVTAQAYAFSGTVTMTGLLKTSLNSKTHINTVTFTNPWTVGSAVLPSGAYAGSAGSAVTYTNFKYNTTTLAVTFPAAPFTLWSFSFAGNTYTFQLDTPLDAAFTSSTSFSMNGHGTGYINGGDASTGFWSISGTRTKASFSFTAASVTSVIPDAGSAVALLGIALAGIEGARLLIRSRKA